MHGSVAVVVKFLHCSNSRSCGNENRVWIVIVFMLGRYLMATILLDSLLFLNADMLINNVMAKAI